MGKLDYRKVLRRYDEYIEIINVVDHHLSLLTKSLLLSSEEFECFEETITSDNFGDAEEIQLGKDICQLLRTYRQNG